MDGIDTSGPLPEAVLRLARLRLEVGELERQLGLGRRAAPAATRTGTRAEPPAELLTFIGPEGDIRFAFTDAVAFLGWPAESLLGRQVRELLHAEDLPRPGALATSPGPAGERSALRHRMRSASAGRGRVCSSGPSPQARPGGGWISPTIGQRAFSE